MNPVGRALLTPVEISGESPEGGAQTRRGRQPDRARRPRRPMGAKTSTADGPGFKPCGTAFHPERRRKTQAAYIPGPPK